MEGQADSYTVEETVKRETACTQFPSRSDECVMFVVVFIFVGMVVEHEESIEDHVYHESKSGDRSNRSWGIHGPAKLESFGNKVKKGYSHDRSSTKSEYEMELILAFQGKKATQKGGYENSDAYDAKHAV
jgi:hypothetical protein